MLKGDQVLLHTRGQQPKLAYVKEIVGNGPMPKCYKVLDVVTEDDKVHEGIVYHEDKGTKGKFWSLLEDEVGKKQEGE
jgi:hypothetical protein